MSDWIEADLVCPRDGARLAVAGAEIRCAHGHVYPLLDGVPVLLLEEATELLPWWPLEAPDGLAPAEAGVDLYVQEIVVGTCGNLYRGLAGRLGRYPIPELRLPPGEGRRLLDIGCNWGRWCVAAARRGYQPIGVDPSLRAIRAARRVAAQLGVDARFVVADARHLPFPDGSVEVAFSYSVLQHFSRDDAGRALAEIGRVLVPGGRSLVQMPNRFGAWNLAMQARRRFREPTGFEVRYWSPRTLTEAFGATIGPTLLSVDGFFSLNAQGSDAALLPLPARAVVAISTALRRLGERVPPLRLVADSLYVSSTAAGR